MIKNITIFLIAFLHTIWIEESLAVKVGNKLRNTNKRALLRGRATTDNNYNSEQQSNEKVEHEEEEVDGPQRHHRDLFGEPLPDGTECNPCDGGIDCYLNPDPFSCIHCENWETQWSDFKFKCGRDPNHRDLFDEPLADGTECNPCESGGIECLFTDPFSCILCENQETQWTDRTFRCGTDPTCLPLGAECTYSCHERCCNNRFATYHKADGTVEYKCA